jgi:hypothetical protein
MRIAVLFLLLFPFPLIGQKTVDVLPDPSFFSTRSYKGWRCNPASAGQIRNFSLSVSGEKKFLVIPAAVVSLRFPVPQGGFLLESRYEGVPFHSTVDFFGGYGRSLGENLFAGLRFGLQRETIPGILQENALSAGAGVLIRISSGLLTGMDIRKSVNDADTSSLPDFNGFLGFAPSGIFFLSLAVEKRDKEPVSVNAAAEYRFHNSAFFSFGLEASTRSWWFGPGFILSRYITELSFSYHPQLGWSPTVSVCFQKKQNDKKR